MLYGGSQLPFAFLNPSDSHNQCLSMKQIFFFENGVRLFQNKTSAFFFLSSLYIFIGVVCKLTKTCILSPFIAMAPKTKENEAVERSLTDFTPDTVYECSARPAGTDEIYASIVKSLKLLLFSLFLPLIQKGIAKYQQFTKVPFMELRYKKTFLTGLIYCKSIACIFILLSFIRVYSRLLTDTFRQLIRLPPMRGRIVIAMQNRLFAAEMAHESGMKCLCLYYQMITE